MGTRIIGMAIAILVCLTIGFPITSAAVTYTAHDATVVSAGPYGTTVVVFSLKVGTATTAKYFKAATGREKEMLAIAVAALTNSRTIRIWKDDAASPGGATIGLATPLYGMELK